MKNIKNYKEFINEELKHLPPPSDEDTFEELNSKSVLRRLQICKRNNLNKKFYPSNQEIYDALKNENSMIVEDIFTYYVEYNLDDNIFWLAIEKGLLNYVKPNQILLDGAVNGKLTVVKFALEKGADINCREKYMFGNTPFLHASEKGHLEIVKYLVEHGANIESTLNNGDTSLMLVSKKNHLNIVKYLIEQGADIDAINNDDWNALIYASYYGKLECVEFLVEHGANVNDEKLIKIFPSIMDLKIRKYLKNKMNIENYKKISLK